MAENDNDEVVDEKESVEDEKEKAEKKAEESESVSRNYPANKYELAIVAAREARRLNENWKEDEERHNARVTEKALEKVTKGEVHYTFVDEQDR